LSELLPVSPLLYIGGCIKLNLFENSFEKIAELAARNRSRIIVDHGRIREITSENMRSAVKELVLRAAYYLPSRDEFCALWGVTDISEGLRRLHVSSPHLTTVIKDGENGAYFLENGKVMQVEAVEVEEIVNLTGAGDAFNAGFIASQAAGKSIRESVLAGTENAARWISQP
jgi:2-dehydro-3-deoxygluconokinase